jgi:benzylsuccinate CoA-transferase BbsF subunit
MAAGMLSGLRVVSLTGAIAGPSTARTLAQFGAEVIKLESQQGGLDSFRYYSTSDDLEASGRFLENNLNVLTAQLNLKTETGVRLFLELVAKSDVLLENFRPGVLPRLGLGPEVLRRARPDLIYLKLPGMGSTGPKSWYGTWGQTLNAMSGMTHLWNHPGQERPVGFQGAYPDYVAAALAPTAILAALLHRRRTGKGVDLELAQAEMAAWMLGVSYLESEVNDREPLPRGNDWPHAAPHNCYPCRGTDRWCAIAVETEEQWQRLCQAMGRPELAGDVRFRTMANRRRHLAELDALVAAWTATRDAHDVMHTLQAAGVPCGVVQSGEDIYKDPQLRARNLACVVEHPTLGPIPVADLPLHFSVDRFDRPRAMGVLGTDNARVFCDILGYSREQLDAWKSDGVVN